MKSILQYVAVLSVAVLITSCGGNSDGDPRGTVTVIPPPPQNGAAGQAVKGIIAGASVSVVDASGAAIGIASGGTTGADGTYSLVFTPAAIAAGITAPLAVIIDGTGATTVCDLDVNGTDDDCLTSDGVTYVAFGETYALPDGFTMTVVLSEVPADTAEEDPVFTANPSPASSLAASLAYAASGDGTTLTVGNVANANAQVLGLIELVTGVTFAEGTLLSAIPLIDLASVGADNAETPEQSFAISAFAAAVAGLVDADTDLGEALAELFAQVAANAEGEIQISGTNLSRLSRQVSLSLGNVSAALTTAGVTTPVAAAVVKAQVKATSTQADGDRIGDAPVPVPVPGGTTDFSLTNSFVSKIVNVLDAWVNTTGFEEGTTGVAPSELFFTELAEANAYGAGPATAALEMLGDALIAAEATLEAGATVTNDDTDTDQLTYTLAKDASTGDVTLTDATAWATGDNNGRARINVASGTYARDPGVSGELSLTGVDLFVERLTGEGETQTAEQLQHFVGSIDIQFAPDATDPGDLGVSSITYGGIHYGVSDTGDSFDVAISLTNVSGTALEGGNGGDVNGSYNMMFTFNGGEGVAIGFDGEIRADTQNFTLTGGGDTIMGSVTRNGPVDVDTLSDGAVTLTLTFDSGTGTGLDSDGTGSAQLALDGNTLSWDIEWSGLSGDATAMHFHGPANIGENAGVAQNIGGVSGLTSPSAGSATLTNEMAADFSAGLWYINIHTAMYPGGEIRGQAFMPTSYLSARAGITALIGNGIFTVGETQTAVINSDGVVTFNSGAIRVLQGSLF